jgi:hypothetical protein
MFAIRAYVSARGSLFSDTRTLGKSLHLYTLLGNV